MKVFSGRHETALSKLMLVVLSLIFIAPSGNRANDVDKSMALLWTSKDASTKVGTLGLLYGDLDVCLEELQRRQTFNTSYYRREYTMNDLTSSYDSVEVVYVSSTVIFFDQAQKTIDVGPYIIGDQGSYSYSIPLSTVSNQVTGLSFDWVSMLLYVSDAGYHRIVLGDASVFNPIWWRPVIDTNLTSPQDVVVCPTRSYIFWIDLDISAKIERFDLVNEIREVLVSNATILRPTKLAIDFESERLYWLDSYKETIGSCNLDGSDVSLWQLSLFSQISAFTFYRQYLFLGDRTRSLIHAFNASRHQVLSDFQLLNNEQGIIDMATYDPSKQIAIESPCTVSKGGCSHFCIRINATARKCLCAVGFFLDSDGISCVTRPFRDNFLVVSDTQQRQLFQVDIANGEVRATIAVDFYLTPTAADYDHVSKNLFWFDNRNTIRQTNLTSGATKVFVDSLGTEITSLAVDPVGRSLYYTWYSAGTIGVISLTTKDIQMILAEPGSRPRVVILDIDRRSLYWSDCGKRSIEKAQMSNASVHQSIVSQLDFCVSALAIDFTNDVIYWFDQGGNIESSKLDGSERSVIYSDSSADYTAMAIDDTYLYLADNTLRQLLKLDRLTNKIESLTGHLFVSPYALIRYSSSSASNRTTTIRSTSSTTTSASQASNRTTTSRPTSSTTTSAQGGASTTTIIVVVVICGSVVLLAVIIVVGVIVAKWMKRRKSSAIPDGYDNIIPSPPEFPKPDSAQHDETYTELEDFSSPVNDMGIDHASDGSQIESPYMKQDEELKETSDVKRQSANNDDYI